MRFVATPVPNTAGIPYSRATIETNESEMAIIRGDQVVYCVLRFAKDEYRQTPVDDEDGNAQAQQRLTCIHVFGHTVLYICQRKDRTEETNRDRIQEENRQQDVCPNPS